MGDNSAVIGIQQLTNKRQCDFCLCTQAVQVEDTLWDLNAGVRVLESREDHRTEQKAEERRGKYTSLL